MRGVMPDTRVAGAVRRVMRVRRVARAA